MLSFRIRRRCRSTRLYNSVALCTVTQVTEHGNQQYWMSSALPGIIRDTGVVFLFVLILQVILHTRCSACLAAYPSVHSDETCFRGLVFVNVSYSVISFCSLKHVWCILDQYMFVYSVICCQKRLSNMFLAICFISTNREGPLRRIIIAVTLK